MSEPLLKKERDVEQLIQQLSVARSEINNLRQEIKFLKHLHKKECTSVQQLVENWSCGACRQNDVANTTPDEHQQNANAFSITYIGKVITSFPEKRATPRQSAICASIARLELDKNVFTNPGHSIEGLQEYSHIWILFHFHKNESTHVRAKVSPPRLNGVRTGVFATRSPHRPCPIGLSLAKIERIEGSTIYFSGVDMVDGTPVLDIKPYIPQYDNPALSCAVPLERLLVGRETETTSNHQSPNLLPSDSSTPGRSESRIGEREAPDGEEEEEPHTSNSANVSGVHGENATTPENQVRVPTWVNDSPVFTLAVIFTDGALAQLQELQGTNTNDRQSTISNILREDPRSVYLRSRWGNQYYTFRIAELHVSCKFDDTLHSVTVFQIRPADSVTEE